MTVRKDSIYHSPVVELTLHKRVDKSLYYLVKVRSAVMPRKKIGILECKQWNQRSEIGVLAGALAEELWDEYTSSGKKIKKPRPESLDPTRVALAGERAYETLIAKLNEMGHSADTMINSIGLVKVRGNGEY
jgi:hypothetical protein